jgi:NAD+ kinase
MAAIRRIGVIAKPQKERLAPVIPELRRWLGGRNLELVCDRETAECVGGEPGVPREQIAAQVDLLLVLGGDGTLLAAARALGHHTVPILPVNLGQLGFLTSVKLEEMYLILDEVLAGKHRISERTQLEAQVARAAGAAETHRALNDVVLAKTTLARIMDFDLAIDGAFVCKYRADGLIIATPTGSTAYSLSAGGPIVYPLLDAFVVTPICTHTLTNRPLVVPDSATLEVRFGPAEQTFYMTLDGQMGVKLQTGDVVTLRKAAQRVQLVRPLRKSYFEILRTKLKWGER